MSPLLVIAGYISAGIGVLLLSMLIDAKFPELNLGEIDDGELAIVLILFWPLAVILILASFAAEKLSAVLKRITKQMKESARK